MAIVQQLHRWVVAWITGCMLVLMFAAQFPLTCVLTQGQEDLGMGASRAIEGRFSSHGGRLCQQAG